MENRDHGKAHARAAILAFALCGGLSLPAAAGSVVLAPHRAIYDLRLQDTPGSQRSGKPRMEAVRGRILYDFSGNTCEGYALQFRQVSQLDSGEGKISLSDLRSTTWEDGASKIFRFNSQNYIDQKIVDAVDGKADRTADGVAVNLSKPQPKQYSLEPNVAFPTEHMRRIVEAALAGQTLIELPVYDGSENGERVFNTLTVIGHEIRPGEKPPSDASGGKPALASMRRWPVTISYFDRTSTRGEQTPVYSISFELFENGISRALSLDYGDFVVAGDLSQLDLGEIKPCQ
jgi:hypothetical protein